MNLSAFMKADSINSGNMTLRRWLALLPPTVAAVGFQFLSGPIPQNPLYHDFADQRTLFGLRHFWDVVTNAPFLVLGALGLLFLWRGATRDSFTGAAERLRLMVFFAGVLLTGVGSAYYHFEPGNGTILWDRLPMSLAFMSLFAIVIGELLSPRAATALFGPLLAGGVASVFWWAWTEHLGHGDLKLYGVMRFYPMVVMVLMLWLLPSRYSHAGMYWGLFLGYTLAKSLELTDHPVYRLTGLLSGHSLKHLAAAGGIWWYLLMLRRRHLVSRPVDQPDDRRGHEQ